jgi:hypothetical protein
MDPDEPRERLAVPHQAVDAAGTGPAEANSEPSHHSAVTPATNPSIYRQLGARQVRLLRVLPLLSPEDPRESIRCVLEITSLDSTPNYIALSYEWGGTYSAIRPGDIYINGYRMDLRSNLVLALRSLSIYAIGSPLFC